MTAKDVELNRLYKRVWYSLNREKELARRRANYLKSKNGGGRMNPNDDFKAMKESQRDKVTDVIITAGIALTSNKQPQIWRDTMKSKSVKELGRVRRFYRYLASFDDVQVDDFLKGFLS